MIKLVLMDLDGTLTEDRDTTRIDLDALYAIRVLQKNSIKVGLVSGNSYPVLRGLYTYLHLDGGFVAENGCIVFFGKEKYRVCRQMDKNLINEFKSLFKLRDTWQNEYRECDFGFVPANLNNEMLEWAKQKNLYIKSSGYAVHLAYHPAGKGIGVRKLLDLQGLMKEEVVGIGDSSTDVELFEQVGFKVAVGNADEELKSIADYVTNNKSGKGVREFVDKLLKGELNVI
ncbi:phosphoglycolate phosphatase [Sulfolobus tengchongensis]|uniref:Phosphoglycolate phosphatase n=1 Tax=Sulfolobus tengchongensis TaxID=207809 RepID=A0AAX4KYR4_9CREN